MGEFDLIATREELIRRVLHRVANERDEPHAHHDAQLEYDDDMLDETVRKYARALDAGQAGTTAESDPPPPGAGLPILCP